jgi:NAD(P)H-dependent FMN reductase
MLQLKIIVASTRPGRNGRMVGDWFAALSQQYSEFNVEILDLKEINLPDMDEAAHPKMKQYQHEHSKQWSAKIDEADAFVIVACEYNHGFSGPLKNAIDYLYSEWNYKPAAFVSYGGVAGGVRAVLMLSQVLTALKIVPLYDTVTIPLVYKFIDQNQQFVANDGITKSAHVMMKELIRWSKALKDMRSFSLTTSMKY